MQPKHPLRLRFLNCRLPVYPHIFGKPALPYEESLPNWPVLGSKYRIMLRFLPKFSACFCSFRLAYFSAFSIVDEHEKYREASNTTSVGFLTPPVEKDPRGAALEMLIQSSILQTVSPTDSNERDTILQRRKRDLALFLLLACCAYARKRAIAVQTKG